MLIVPTRLDELLLAASIRPTLSRCVNALALWFVGCTLLVAASSIHADELILDESLTETQTVGDFDVGSGSYSAVLDDSGLFDKHGEISAGKLYSFFKSQGIKSIDRLNFAIDLDPNSDRSDYQLDSIRLEIEDLNSESGRRLFSLGDRNSLKLPGYEASNLKPEAEIGVYLGYDYMQQFNENSTEKIKFHYTVDGEQMAVPARIGILSQGHDYSPTRVFFLMAFAGFWAIVFMVLFRVTSPKQPHNATSPA